MLTETKGAAQSRTKYFSRDGELLATAGSDTHTIRNRGFVREARDRWSEEIGNLYEDLLEEDPHISREFAEKIEGQLAMRFEAQAGHLRSSPIVRNTIHTLNQIQEGVLTEAPISSGQLGPYVTHITPLQRRMALKSIGHHICDIQPTLGPIGALAFIRPRYETTRGAIVQGDEINNDFDFNYTSDNVSGMELFTGDGTSVNFAARITETPIFPETVRFISSNSVVGTINTTTGALTNASGVLAGASGGIDVNTGAVVLSLASAPAAGVKIYVSFRFDLEGSAKIADISQDIDIKPVRVNSRKIRYIHSFEAYQDYGATWGRDLDEDMLQTASQEIMLERDREIVAKQWRAVLTRNRFEYSDFARSGITRKEQLQDLAFAIEDACASIEAQCGYNVNYIVAPVTLRPYFSLMEGFVASGGAYDQRQNRVQRGYFNGKRIFFLRGLPTDEMLLGVQGMGVRESGTVHMPYIDFEITEKFANPMDQTVVRSMISRYLTQVTRPEFYARLKIDRTLTASS